MEVHTSAVDDDPLPPERAVRLLRAKAAEMEQVVLLAENDDLTYTPLSPAATMADVALIASLLADLIERQEARWKWSHEGKS